MGGSQRHIPQSWVDLQPPPEYPGQEEGVAGPVLVSQRDPYTICKVSEKMEHLATKVAVRFAASLLTPEYVEALLKGLDQSNAPDAATRLQALARNLRNGTLDPFPISELGAFLSERGVPDDEVDLVTQVKVRTPKAPKAVNFTDAFLQFGREASVSVVPDMRFELDPDAGKAVLAWLSGFKKLKPLAKKIWSRAVKKVHFGKPQGTEDASWRPGGVMTLDVTRLADPKTRTSQLTHELGHAFEELHHLGGEPPWGEPPFISDYAEFKPGVEDVAESFRAFIEEPANLKRKCPEKYALIDRLL